MKIPHRLKCIDKEGNYFKNIIVEQILLLGMKKYIYVK